MPIKEQNKIYKDKKNIFYLNIYKIIFLFDDF